MVDVGDKIPFTFIFKIGLVTPAFAYFIKSLKGSCLYSF